MTVPGMLHGALRFSDHPRARVLRIDTSRASAHPGVVAVADRGRRSRRADAGRRSRGTGGSSSPRARRRPTSATCSQSSRPRRATQHARRLRSIEVEYEVLEPVTDPFEALADGAPRCTRTATCSRSPACSAATSTRRSPAPAHVVSPSRSGRSSSSTPSSSPSRRSPCRSRTAAARLLAGAGRLGRPPPDRVVPRPARGAGARDPGLDRRRLRRQGGRSTSGATRRCSRGRPDARSSSRSRRKESLRFHAKRHPMWLDYTVGCDGEGTSSALRARIVGDTGAYASVGDKVLERAAGHACGAVQACRTSTSRRRAVYTNNPPCGAMRGFGVNQANFAIEGVLDELAELRRHRRLGDPLAQRARERRPLRHRAEARARRRPEEDAARRARRLPRRALRRASPARAKNTGIGNGVPEYGRAILRPEADGTVTLYHSWTEMGQGVHTILAPDRLRGARPRRPIGSASSSTPSASSRPARRPPRARPCSAATP